MCGVPVVAGGGFYFVCVLSHVSNLRLVNRLLFMLLLLPPPWALRVPHRTRLSLRFLRSFVIVLPFSDFILCLLAALQACVYLPPFHWLPVRLG